MENVFLTSLTTPEVRQLFREVLTNYFAENDLQPQPTPQPEQTFTIKELADYLKVTVCTIQAYKRRGVIPFYQIGRTVLFKKSEVDAAMSSKTKSRKS